MKKYWRLYLYGMQDWFAWRLNLFLEFLGTILSFIVAIFLWQAAFKGQASIGGFTFNQMLTYLIGTHFLLGFISLVGIGDGINYRIKEGVISHWLTRPYSIPLRWFLTDLGRVTIQFLFSLAALLVAVLIWKNQIYIANVPSIFLAGVFVLFGVFVHFFFFSCFALLAFWAEETWGPRFLLRIIMEVATGAIVPLSFYPTWLGAIFQILPFKFFASVPMETYLGSLSRGEIISNLIQGTAWLAASIVAYLYIYSRGVKNYIAVGG